MYCLIDFCCICFDNKEHLQPLSRFGSDDITYINKLTSCIPETCFNQMNNKSLICNKCCVTMDAAYKFRQRCLRNNTTLTEYISHLHQIGNISDVVNVYLTDLNKFIDIQKENNIEKTEMFINVNENTIDENFVINSTTEIKRENNPINLKLIDYGNNYIPFENVIIKMEQNNLNSDEDIEETFDNISVNQHDTKIDVSQNNIKLTASAINRGNENQDFEKHLHERLDNNLEILDRENDDMAANVEENNYKSLYSEKCFDDPLASLDEMKIDIVVNDIKPMNSEINIQCKSENNEECSSEDNDRSLEDEDKTDKEMKIFHKIPKLEKKKPPLSKNVKQKNCAEVNQNDKIVKKYECSICKKNFPQTSSLNRHMRIHTGQKTHTCDVCQKNFKESSNLNRHMRIHTGEKPHECDVCHKKFIQSHSLKMHLKIHTGEKQHECDVCHKKFTASFNLMLHKRIHTGEKPYACDICQKKFSYSSHLREHIKLHTGLKSHECDICHKKFNQSSALRIHMKKHIEEKSYECDICKKKFNQSSTLKMHMRIHTGEKPHECNICQKKFNQSCHLTQHMRIHTREKPHECDVCQKNFTQSSTLKKHMIIHTGEKPHECDVCQKKFNQLSTLSRHMRIHTGEKPDEFHPII